MQGFCYHRCWRCQSLNRKAIKKEPKSIFFPPPGWRLTLLERATFSLAIDAADYNCRARFDVSAQKRKSLAHNSKTARWCFRVSRRVHFPVSCSQKGSSDFARCTRVSGGGSQDHRVHFFARQRTRHHGSIGRCRRRVVPYRDLAHGPTGTRTRVAQYRRAAAPHAVPGIDLQHGQPPIPDAPAGLL